jgi:hypothetical protein
MERTTTPGWMRAHATQDSRGRSKTSTATSSSGTRHKLPQPPEVRMTASTSAAVGTFQLMNVRVAELCAGAGAELATD